MRKLLKEIERRDQCIQLLSRLGADLVSTGGELDIAQFFAAGQIENGAGRLPALDPVDSAVSGSWESFYGCTAPVAQTTPDAPGGP